MLKSTGAHINSGTAARIAGVDVLRGLAILLVLMNHVNMRLFFAHVPYTRGLPAQVASSLVWNGQQGVQIFFAVSGFLITSTSLRRWGGLEQIAIGGFYRMRFARIAPLLLALLAVLSGLHVAGLRWPGLSDFVVPREAGGLGRALLAAVTFHVNWLEASRAYLPANWDILWSLSVEEMFYLFFPLLCRGLVRGGRWLFPALLLGFVVAGPFARATAFNEVWREYSYLGGMDAIALGCLTALLLHGRRPGRGMLWLAGATGAGLMAFCLGFSRTAAAWGLERIGLSMTLLAVGTCLVIAVAAQTGWREPLLLRPLTGIGRASYEVYLTHMFVVFALFHLFVGMGKPLALVPGLFVCTIVMAGLVGWVVARVYSEPMNRRLRRGGVMGSVGSTIRHG